jgi:aspartate kinase
MANDLKPAMTTNHLRRVTMKFGGTSVKDAACIGNAARVAKELHDQGTQVVVVTSARAGVTDRLVSLVQPHAVEPAGEAERVAHFFRATRKLEEEHLAVARDAIRNVQLVEEAGKALYSERSVLERVLLGSHLLGEMTPIGHDIVVSEGERLCVPLLVNCLRDLGVDAVGVPGDECGIVTDNNYGRALPVDDATRDGVRGALLPLLEAGRLPVVTGFYGRSQQGRIAILGRGGSDYSATLIGCALDCDEIWILKEVDGIQTTDPRLVPSARTLPEVSYLIAAEMSQLGAKVLHPRSILPALRQNVPVRIANSFRIDLPGTRLVAVRPDQPPGVTALSLVRGGGLVRVIACELGNEDVVDSRLTKDLRDANVEVLATATGLNGGSVLWLLGKDELRRFLPLLNRYRAGQFEIEVAQQAAILGIVGHKAATVPGIHQTIARCLDEVGVQPLANLSGASANSIVLALPDDQGQLMQTLQLLHSRLVSGATA